MLELQNQLAGLQMDVEVMDNKLRCKGTQHSILEAEMDGLRILHEKEIGLLHERARDKSQQGVQRMSDESKRPSS